MNTGELQELLHHAYDGDPWHGPSLKSVLAGISAPVASARPLAERHSIWEIVLHITGWTREVERRLRGGAPTQPEGGDWPTVPPKPTPTAWLRTLAALEAAHRSLEEAVSQAPTSRWKAIVGKQRDAAQGTGYSFGTMVVGLATHHAYHAGQIAVLTPRAPGASSAPPALHVPPARQQPRGPHAARAPRPRRRRSASAAS